MTQIPLRQSEKRNLFFLAVFFVCFLSCFAADHNDEDNASKTTTLFGKLQTERVSSNVSTESQNVSEVLALKSSLTIVTHLMFEKQHRFCRLKGVCRTGDGTLLVPKWMNEYSEHISKCGIERVVYLLSNKVDEAGHDIISIEDKEDKITLRDNYRHYDVIGNKEPRAERSLLVTDITPSILILDLFSRPGAYSKTTNTLCTTSTRTECKPENYSDPLVLNPIMFIDSRIGETKDFRWPKSLLRLVRNSMGGALQISELKDLYGWRVRSEASCFRSIISTNAIASDIPAESILESHLFFSKNSLSRRVVNSQHSNTLSMTCSAKVLILNRYGKRFIEGSDKLSLAISSLAQEVRERNKRIFILPEVVFFENSSFHEQVSVMQETSVVVASHGSGNANFMFLRPQTRVFEILPFGLLSDLYRNISRVYGSVYNKLVGQPDEEVFLACVSHFNPQESGEREEFLKAWKTAASSFKQETIKQKANIISGYVIPEDDEETESTDDQVVLKSLRQCASYQRIAVDIKHLAKTVTKAAAEQCGFNGDFNFLST